MSEPSGVCNGTRPLVGILAGGRGRRLGGRKPSAHLGGEPLIARPLAAAREAGLEAVIVAKRSSELPPLNCETVFEPEAPRHPLCGIAASIKHGAGRPIVILACDMPFVTGPLLAWLAFRSGCCVTEVAGRIQPLLARYTPADLPVIERALQQGISMRAAAMRLRPARIDERALSRFGDPHTLCFNVNDVSELARARQLAGAAHANERATRKRAMPR